MLVGKTGNLELDSISGKDWSYINSPTTIKERNDLFYIEQGNEIEISNYFSPTIPFHIINIID